MATKKKFLAKHGLAVNTDAGSTATLNYPTHDGTAGQFIQTDGSGALTFGTAADDFLDLADTPSAYTGNNGKGVLVKADGTGLEFGGGTVVNSVNRQELTGNGGTAFTLSTTYSSGNHIFVFVDGVIQNTPANYSLSGTTLTFTSAPANGADILVMGFLPSAGIIDVGDLIPDVDSSRDLGSTSKMFNNLFVNNIAADSDVTIAGTLNGHSVPTGAPGGKFLLATEVTVGTEGTATGNGAIAATADANGVELVYSPPTPAGIGALATDGDGANVTNLNASALATGTVAMARINAAALTAHINATVAPVFSNITSVPDTDTALTEGSTNKYLNDTNLGNTSIDKLSDVDITTSAPSNNDVLKWDGSKFVPGTDTTITILDADDFAGATSTNVPSAESVKAYVDTQDATKQNTLTFGIANTNAVAVDGSTAADNNYARFTTTGIEGRTPSEVKGDIGAMGALTDDGSPQLSAELDVNGQPIVSVSNGNIALVPDGTGQTRITNLQYNEDVHDIGTTGGTITPDVINGNVQKINLNNNLTFNAFNNPVAGQSLTLIINTNGTGRTLTSSFLYAGGNKTLSSTNTIDILTVFYDGSNYYANLVTNYS